jgi:hypothetical protein
MRLGVVLLLMVALLAGCLSGKAPPAASAPTVAPAGAFQPDPPQVPVPAGCDRSKPVVLHHFDGVPAATFPGPRPVACYYPTGKQTGEPALGILSDGTVFIGPGQDMFSSTSKVGVLRTTNQGATWDLVYPDIAGVPSHQTTLDPYLYVDPKTSRVWAEDLSPAVNTAINSWSDDGGKTWTNGYAGGMEADHVTVFSGPPVTSTMLGYPDIVYRCAIAAGATAGFAFAIVCQRSLDGGLTWLPHGEPAYTFLAGFIGPIAPVDSPLLQPCWSGNGHGFTDQAGRVYLPRGHCGQPYLAWSDDEGMTWTRKQVSDLGTTCVPPHDICEHDAGVGVDSNGTLYFAWVAYDRLLYMTRSFDRGLTWDKPRQVGLPGLTETTHVQLAAGGKGKIGFVYYGTKNGPAIPWTDGYEETTWDPYMAVSYDADSADPTFATAQMDTPGDPAVRHQCGPVRCDGLYDYIDIRIAPDGMPWSPLVDACTGPCVTDAGSLNNDAAAAGGRLWNVDLWDASDPNGPYP